MITFACAASNFVCLKIAVLHVIGHVRWLEIAPYENQEQLGLCHSSNTGSNAIVFQALVLAPRPIPSLQFVRFQARRNQPTIVGSIAAFPEPPKGFHSSSAAPPAEPNRALPTRTFPGGLRPESPNADGQMKRLPLMRRLREYQCHWLNLRIAEVKTQN